MGLSFHGVIFFGLKNLDVSRKTYVVVVPVLWNACFGLCFEAVESWIFMNCNGLNPGAGRWEEQEWEQCVWRIQVWVSSVWRTPDVWMSEDLIRFSIVFGLSMSLCKAWLLAYILMTWSMTSWWHHQLVFTMTSPTHHHDIIMNENNNNIHSFVIPHFEMRSRTLGWMRILI